MRLHLRSVAALAAALLVTTASARKSAGAVATECRGPGIRRGAAKETRGKIGRHRRWDRQSREDAAKQLGKMNSPDMPLTEALEFLSHRTGVTSFSTAEP